MSKPSLVRRVRDEIGAGLRLGPVLLVALVLAAVVWRVDTAADPSISRADPSISRAASGLFQSSPVGTPTPVPTMPVSPFTPTALPSPTPVLTGTPSLATPTPPLMPTDAPTATPPLTPTVAPTMTPVLTVTPAAGGAEATPADASATPDDREHYPGDDSSVRFEWGMLFDSVSLLLSYTWLCCGVLIFLAIPVVFVVLWVASKLRQQQ